MLKKLLTFIIFLFVLFIRNSYSEEMSQNIINSPPSLSDNKVDSYYLNNPSCVIDRGNPARTGEYLTTSLEKVHGIAWSIPIEDTNSFICYNNFIITNGPTITSVDQGKEISHNSIQSFNEPGIIAYKNTLYYSGKFNLPSPLLEGYDLLNKKLNIQSPISNIASDILILNDVMYLAVSNKLIAYNLLNNQILWQFNLTGENLEITALSSNGKFLFFSDWMKGIYAINKSNGKLVWKISDIPLGNSYITYYENKIFLYDQSVYAFDANTGKPVWKKNVNGINASSLTISDHIVYVSSFTDALYALDTDTGKILWKFPIHASSLPVVAGDLVYLLANETLYAINKKTGKEQWNIHIPYENDCTPKNGGIILPYQNKIFIAGVKRRLVSIF